VERGSMYRSPAQYFPRQRGPPARRPAISRSTHFMMPMSARTGGKRSLPHAETGNSEPEIL